MRCTILVRPTIHTRAVLLRIDQYMDMHQHFHNKIAKDCITLALFIERKNGATDEP